MHSFDEYKKLIEDNLELYLPDSYEHSARLREAISYSLGVGGKRIRPVLLLAASEASGGDLSTALPYACAIEYIHTYSLIHDDLPAMDDDDMRRGRPSNHKMFGEAMAILAGDALLNTAAELMTSQALKCKGNAEALYAHIRAANEILTRSGAAGMIAGQTADILSQSRKATADAVIFIEEHKTADLIIAPVRAGLMLSNASDDVLDAYTSYAQDIGIAFQILDDILDVEGDENKVGKTLGKDIAQDKCSYVNFHGIDKAHSELSRLSERAKASIDHYPGSEFFKEFADILENRIN